MALVKPLVFGKPRLEYLKCVLNDSEFRARAAEIHSRVDLNNDNTFSLRDGSDVKVPLIGTNPERSISEEITLAISSIQDDFELGSYETIGLLNDELPNPEGEFKRLIISDEPIDEVGLGPLLRLYILPGASKRDILESLNELGDRMKSTYGKDARLRTKGPQNYQLVYAIHRARRNGAKFSDIFREYGLGKLSNYSGSRSITSLDKFREYYRRYEPKQPSNGWILDADSDELRPMRGIGLSDTPT